MENKPIECKKCKKSFIPSGRSQLYCSKECTVLDNITIDNNCWNWTKSKNKKGYGKLTYNKITYMPHRIICESVHGPAPIDKPYVLHSCDNPSCCNPDHLRWGTHGENMDDRNNRNRCNPYKGENHISSKLTEKQIIEIIDKLKNYKHGDYEILAYEYKITSGHISSIHKNKKWKHIPRN